METTERTVQAAEPRQRRVGTFTLGLVLVIAGAGMLASMFYPPFRPEWLLKASPCILILLGIETLLSSRGGGRVKYDWLGMLLCFLLTGAALCMYCAAWWVVNAEAHSLWDASRWANEDVYEMTYSRFDGGDSHTMYLEAGDALHVKASVFSGWLEAEILDGEGNAVLEASSLSGDRDVPIPRTGDYTIQVWGRHTSGGFAFVRVPGGEPPEDSEAPEGETAPEEEAPPAVERYANAEA